LLPEFSNASYADLVFINCPFDEEYLELFRAIIFTVYKCGFTPLSSMVEDNALDNRIDKIISLIEKCKFGIHDISRTELNGFGLPRFNMPFELGLFYAARRFGAGRQKHKNALILEKTRYAYQKYLSDINGVDIKAHSGNTEIVIRLVRNWLKMSSDRKTIPGPISLASAYEEFNLALPEAAKVLGFVEINEIPFVEYCLMVEEAIRFKLF
jgi:hypothetical protein